MNRKWKKRLSEVVSVVLSLFILFPIYMLVVNSFKDYAGATKLGLSPAGIRFSQIASNYKAVIEESRLWTAYENSLIITSVTVALTVLFASITGFILQRRQSRVTELINIVIILGLSVPFVAPTTFFLNKSLGLSQSLTGIIIVFLALSFPFSVFLFTSYCKSIPRSLDESATIDGCGPLRLFFSVIFPLIVPVVYTVVIITSMGVWNDFGVSIFLLNSPSRFTVVLTTFNFYGQKHSDWSLLFANIVLISLPVVILYLFLQRYIVSGLTAGAVKG